jgi:hypothetical protein
VTDLRIVHEDDEDPFLAKMARGEVRDPEAYVPRTHSQRVAEELAKLRARRDATELFNAEQAEKAKREMRECSRVVDGAAFLLDIPSMPAAIWGKDDQILWARGESLMVGGPQGVGKTTLAGQLLRASVGLITEVLGFPVQSFENSVGYLAMDRPQQAQRALGRMFSEEERNYIRDMIKFWRGPLPTDAAIDPDTLVRAAYELDTECLFVDSLKDAAIGLSKDEVGAGYNRARQRALTEGIQLSELHHTVKNGADGGRPNNLNGVYGSTWLTAGAGSVVMLWGEAGDEVVELLHLKQPMSDVGPFKIQHDRETGLSSVYFDEDTDLVALARRCKTSGVTLLEAARHALNVESPTPAQKQKVRRKLDRLVSEKLLTEVPGDKGRGCASRWFAAAPSNWGEPNQGWGEQDAA